MAARIKKEKLPEPLKVRLRSLYIENYKGIDKLEIQFPGPKLSTDPHVTVIGSENGLGKTSILECCALLLLSLSDRKDANDWWPVHDFMQYGDVFIDPIQLMVRAGARLAKIRGSFSLSGDEFTVSLTCGQKGISLEGFPHPKQLWSIFEPSKRIDHREQRAIHILSLLGIIGEPMIFPPFLYFNSYRKIQEGSPELGLMLSGSSLHHYARRRYGPGSYTPISAFKIEIIRALMGRQGLFESVNEAEAESIVQELNALIADYAHGTLSKLRELEERGVELLVNPRNSESSYPFDGLSSGQKEIISTLFLIWKYTRKQSGIVLIDEPELHLNAEWHRGFIRRLSQIQPLNQYIVATHSEHVFDSVDERNRILLQPTKNNTHGSKNRSSS